MEEFACQQVVWQGDCTHLDVQAAKATCRENIPEPCCSAEPGLCWELTLLQSCPPELPFPAPQPLGLTPLVSWVENAFCASQEGQEPLELLSGDAPGRPGRCSRRTQPLLSAALPADVTSWQWNVGPRVQSRDQFKLILSSCCCWKGQISLSLPSTGASSPAQGEAEAAGNQFLLWDMIQRGPTAAIWDRECGAGTHLGSGEQPWGLRWAAPGKCWPQAAAGSFLAPGAQLKFHLEPQAQESLFWQHLLLCWHTGVVKLHLTFRNNSSGII